MDRKRFRVDHFAWKVQERFPCFPVSGKRTGKNRSWFQIDCDPIDGPPASFHFPAPTSTDELETGLKLVIGEIVYVYTDILPPEMLNV
jgi:hypothetical protein